MEIKGKIVSISPEVSGTNANGKSWRKKEYVIETDGRYPKKIAFSVMGDHIDRMPMLYGQTYSIEVDAESRQYKDKWYTSLTAFRLNG